jgi:hypothetical protein
MVFHQKAASAGARGHRRPARPETGYGRVRDALDDIGHGPEQTVVVHAHTLFGDLTVHRS